MRGDLIFKNHLDLQLALGHEPEEKETISYEDISHIDPHNCTFNEFVDAMSYARESNPDFDFNNSTLYALEPINSQDGLKHDFINIAEKSRITATQIGNIALFNDLQKIVSAAEYLHVQEATPIDATNYEILSNCIVGMGDIDPYKIAAIKHADSSPSDPKILIQVYSLNSNEYLPGYGVIDLNSIDKSDATLLEAFAYMSYQDFLKGQQKQSFDELLSSGKLGIVSLNDMSTKRINLSVV